MRKILIVAFFLLILSIGFSPLVNAATPGTSKNCDCSGNLYNCADFPTSSEAQSCFDYCKILGKGDVHRLDADDDDIVCESGMAKTGSKKSYDNTSSDSSGSRPPGKCYVNGYRKKSGNYVNGYCRKC